MAKDDYHVIVYRILVYLYGCLKREIIFEDITFEEAVKKNITSDIYFYEILRMMQAEGFVEGLTFKKAWGGDIILISDIRDAKITAEGIQYLKENSTMHMVGNALKETADIISKLASMLLLV